MKINAIHVEGFGVWSQLRVEGFGEGLNVIYGPNEAGKTTLLEFVRSILYGFSSVWGSYLPPLRSRRAGGWMELSTPQGVFRIQRLLDEQDLGETSEEASPTSLEFVGPDAQNRLGRLRVLGPQGVVEDGSQLASLLGGVDETIYQNIFAVGLREIQQLGLLNGTEAAGLLYALSAGVDRVCLVQVMRELRSARHRLLAPGNEPCQLAELLARREKLRGELLAARRAAAQYPHLLAQRDQADQEAHRLQTQLADLQRQMRWIETALAVRDRLEQRGRLDAQLAALPAGKPVSAEMLQRWETLSQALQEYQAQSAALRAQSEQLQEELARLTVEERVVRQGTRIRAFAEQIPWLTALEERMSALQEEIAALETKLAEFSQNLGVPGLEAWDQVFGDPATVWNERTWARVREPAAKIRRLRRQRREAHQRAAAAQQTAQALQEQLQQALADRGWADLGVALQQTGDLLAQLHRCQEIDKQIAQLHRRQAELAKQTQVLGRRQVPSLGEMIGWGALFVVGMALVLWGGILPGVGIGSLNLWVAGLGMAALMGSVFGKLFLEQRRRGQLQTCSRQRKLLDSQCQQLQEERRSLESSIPPGPGSLAERIQQVQQELAFLEQLTPLDTRRQAAVRELQAAEEALHGCQQQLQDAHRRWQETLEVLGLPTRLSPAQVRKLQEHAERLAELQQRLHRCRQEYAQHQQQWEQLRDRIRAVAAEVGLEPVHLNPIESIRLLEQSFSEQQARWDQRRQMRRQLRMIQKQLRRCQRGEARIALHRRRLLRQAGAANEEAFRRRALETAQAQELAQQRQILQREIEAALAGVATEEELAPYLECSDSLETQRDQLAAQIEQRTRQLQTCYEQRGRLNEQIRQWAEDRTLARKRLQWAQLQRQIDEVGRRWQVLALTSHLLDRLRVYYEREHQPETLQETSEYFSRLTQGRYARVWRPLDEEELRVDLADGRSLSVDRLSQGTRELLFLSLRLALVSAYGRRGVRLPMILDDVLVNFDTARAKAAAALLRDFANQGHQVLVFTCHEHLQKLFRELRTPQAVLPDWSQAPPPRITLEIPSQEKKFRRKPTELEPLDSQPTEKGSSLATPSEPVEIAESPSPSVETISAAEPNIADREPDASGRKDGETDLDDAAASLEEAIPPDEEEDFPWYEMLPEDEDEELSSASLAEPRTEPDQEGEGDGKIPPSGNAPGSHGLRENIYTPLEQNPTNQRREITEDRNRSTAERYNSVSSWETDAKTPSGSARPRDAEAA